MNIESPPRYPVLSQDTKTDVLVVGGGLAGVLCARLLTDSGVDCALIEAGRLFGGTTGNTTAKITVAHGLIYSKILSEYGFDTAQGYLSTNSAALEKYREMCAPDGRGIDCSFEEMPSYVYTLDGPSAIEREIVAMNRLGCKYSAEFAMCPALPFETAGAVMTKRQAQFDPLRFGYRISKSLKIYERTKAVEFSPKGVKTDGGFIRADKIIVCTHFPIVNKHGAYFAKLYQSRSYITALENAPSVGGMYIDESGKGLSFRNAGKYLLLGGAAHRTGKSGGDCGILESAREKYYPDSREVTRWAAQDCMSLDGIPYIGQHGKSSPNMLVATGFNKWGMTSSMVAAELLRDSVIGKKNDYAEIFSPQRSIVHPQLFANMAETAAGFLTPTLPRFLHLGCSLRKNAAENSLDCPCHGSRFSASGELLDGPATGDLERKSSS